jgi:dimethylglycine dehydrogenase
VREAVGINEIHNFGKYEVTGPEAESWLNTIMAGRMPKQGKMALTPMLSPRGRIIGDFTISRLGPEKFQLIASYSAQAFHMRWFERHLPEKGVEIRNMSLRRLGFQIAGPKARELLSRVADTDVSNAAFPFLTVRRMEVGLAPAIVQRVTYTGDLGYEIYVPARFQVALYDALTDAGRDLGLTPFGMRAMMSLRLEKSFGAWLREFKPDYTPAETGLDRFISFKKNDFIGRDAAMAEKQTPPKRRLCTLIVDAADADVWGDEPIWRGGKVVGFVTSGGYAHYAKASVALGLVPVEMIEEGAEFDIEILGDLRPARLITEPLFDPEGARMRG